MVRLRHLQPMSHEMNIRPKLPKPAHSLFPRFFLDVAACSSIISATIITAQLGTACTPKNGIVETRSGQLSVKVAQQNAQERGMPRLFSSIPPPTSMNPKGRVSIVELLSQASNPNHQYEKHDREGNYWNVVEHKSCHGPIKIGFMMGKGGSVGYVLARFDSETDERPTLAEMPGARIASITDFISRVGTTGRLDKHEVAKFLVLTKIDDTHTQKPNSNILILYALPMNSEGTLLGKYYGGYLALEVQFDVAGKELVVKETVLMNSM